jgi:hypothetical protein
MAKAHIAKGRVHGWFVPSVAVLVCVHALQWAK